MPSWKKIIQSGSKANLSDITSSKALIVNNIDGGDVKLTIANSNSDTGMDKTAGIYFNHSDPTDLQDAGKIISTKQSLYSGFSGTIQSNLRFYTAGGAIGDKQRLMMYGTNESSTRVGIGFSESDTTLPTVGLTVNGNISASGIVYASQFLTSSIAGNLPVDGDIIVGGTISSSGFIKTDTNITASGNIQTTNLSASGFISASKFVGDGSQLTNVGGGGGGGGDGIFAKTGSKYATTNAVEITGSLLVSGSSTFTNIGLFNQTGDTTISGSNINLVPRTGEVFTFRAGDFVQIKKPTSGVKEVQISGSLKVSGSNTVKIEGPTQFTGSVEITDTSDANFRFKAGDFFEIKKSPKKEVVVSGSLKVSGSNTFQVEGPTELTGSLSVIKPDSQLIVDDSGISLSSSITRITGSMIATDDVTIGTGVQNFSVDASTGTGTFTGAVIAVTSSTDIARSAKFLPKDLTAEIGSAEKRISTIYMSSNIDFNSGSNNILQFSGGQSGQIRFLGSKYLFSENAADGTDIETINSLSPFMHINPVRIGDRVPIFRIGTANRAIFDVTTRGSTDYSGGGGGSNLIPASLVQDGSPVPVDKFNQAPVNANVVIRDYQFSSPPSGGYWIDFQTVSSGSGGITSGSAGVIGMHAGKPVFSLGTNQPSASLHISSSVSGSVTDIVRIQNDIGVPVFKIKPDKLILRNSGSSANETTMSVDSNNNLVINDNFKVNHKDVRFKSGSKEVIARVNPTSGQINFESDDGSKIGFKGAEREYIDENGKITTKVTKDGEEFIRSGSAIANQIHMQQNSNGAFITVSGSTPGYNIIRTGTSDKRLIRENYDLFVTNAGANVWTAGMTPNGSSGNYYSISPGIAHKAPTSPSEFFVSGSGLVGATSMSIGTTDNSGKRLTVAGDISASGNLYLQGNIHASEITSSIISSSIIYSSGSNIFGDASNDTHTFNGNITASGDISSSGNIIADGIKATLPVGVDNSVVILDADGFLKTDEVDAKIFDAIIGNTGGGNIGSAHDNKFTFIDDGDNNTLSGDSNLKNVSGGVGVTGTLTVGGVISSSGNIDVGTKGVTTANTGYISSSQYDFGGYYNGSVGFKDLNLWRFSASAESNEGQSVALQLYRSGVKTVNISSQIGGTSYFGHPGGHKFGFNTSVPQNVGVTVAGIISSSGDIDTDSNISASGDINIGGTLTATRKSFVIPHPTDEDKQLQYASLEGPENGVYIRGKLKGNDIIELPHYWSELIDEETISVSLTSIGRFQYLYVKDISSKEIMVGINNEAKRKIYCHYVVYAERKDIDKLEVEIKNG